MRNFIRTTAIIISTIFLISCAGNPTEKEKGVFSLEYQKYTGVNPLKGFMDYDGGNKDSFPHSLEYIPINLDQVMTGENQYDFSVVENALVSCSESHHQAVIRFILDTPNENCHIPNYIKNKINTFSYSYDGAEGISPDYNDEYFINQICSFIKAFSKYDGDPRIASVQTGIIGHWGEQHIYYVENSKDFSEEWQVKNSTWETFFKEWGTDFTKTKLSARNPSRPGHKQFSSIAYYNDMICSSSDDAYFDELLATKNANPSSWKTSHVSGEIAPGLQDVLIASIVNNKNSAVYKKYVEDIKKYHISCAIFAELFDKDKSFLNKNQKSLLQTQSLMGYDLYVENASLKYDEEILTVQISLNNKGVAPFVYDWPVELSIFDGEQICNSFYPDWKISDIIDNKSSRKLSFSDKVVLDESKEYSILLKIVNPMKNGYPVKFSNKSQDYNLEGYLTLGKIDNY